MKGWLLDAYHSGDKMVVWVKTEDGQAVRLEDLWTHSIYLATDDSDNLKLPLSHPATKEYIKSHEIVSRYERIVDSDRSSVLKLTLNQSSRALALAKEIESFGPFGKFRLYNVDVPPAQAYFYEKGLFPLAQVETRREPEGLAWKVLDSVWDTDYRLPDFRVMDLDVRLVQVGPLPKFTDKLRAIICKTAKEGEEFEVAGESESSTLLALQDEIEKADPDFVVTHNGDSFLFPYVIHRAAENDIALVLGRDGKEQLKRPHKEGTSYFSYGRVHFKPAAVKLQGRIHVDARNSFAMDSAGWQGLYEISRICRMPLHTASRASIGRCLSSLQYYHATQDGLLIPWRPTISEHFKTYGELLVADRGGFIFEPRIGVFEKVAEYDFASLYPSIMYQKNISAETVKCMCCPNSKERVPELDYNICEKRRGIVPKALEIVLKKRAKYKILKKNSQGEARNIYDARQTALKWINVTSFGYLGFNNAKFGRIDAHIAVCAFDRKLMLQSTRIAEGKGFRVLHGIVDSLWVQKQTASTHEYTDLKAAFEHETGFAISFEGVYKWIAFLYSNDNRDIPVANRYFGAFEDGSLKVRGIEARRHDTPPLFARFQQEALEAMAKGNTIEEVKAILPEVQQIFERYADALRKQEILPAELVFTKQLSRDAGRYQDRDTVEANAIHQLVDEGKSLRAGQVLQYVITNYQGKRGRTLPIELVKDGIAYDSAKYIELLARVLDTITNPFLEDS